jgi:hypothetical protein
MILTDPETGVTGTGVPEGLRQIGARACSGPVATSSINIVSGCETFRESLADPETGVPGTGFPEGLR